MAPLLLVLILGASVFLFSGARRELHINADDRPLLAASRQVAAGQWSGLLTPQDVHVVPLMRLVRLWFDLGFPERFRSMFWVAVAAHLASATLLFLLCRPYLASPWSALATAALFAWNTLGAAAFVIHSQYSYVLSVPFLLAALLFLRRYGTAGSARFAVAGGLSLAAAVGLHSIPAIAAVPGVLAGFYLLRTPPAGRAPVLPAWLACTVPALAGLVLWLIWCFPVLPAGHRPGWGALLGGALETLRHFSFLVWHNTPTPGVMLALASAFLALLIAARRQSSFGWLSTVAAICVPPAFVILQDRQPEAYNVSRYTYQSFLLVAAAGGCLLDLTLGAVRSPAARGVLLGLLMLAAPLHFAQHRQVLNRIVLLLRQRTDVPQEFWLAWTEFFVRASDRARQEGTVFRLPPVPVSLTTRSDEVFAICNPYGRASIQVLDPAEVQAEDCERFWREVRRFEPVAGPLGRALAGAPPAGSACATSEAAAAWYLQSPASS